MSVSTAKKMKDMSDQSAAYTANLKELFRHIRTQASGGFYQLNGVKLDASEISALQSDNFNITNYAVINGVQYYTISWENAVI